MSELKFETVSVEKKTRPGSEGALMQSNGLWGEQDRCSGTSILGELDQRDGVDLADQHGQRAAPVVHSEHPL